jgi:hypothetical protein
MWAWHEAWESAPPEIVKETGPQWTAPGIAINFCPDGRFRMASGVFYRGSNRITLGSSDGLSLYEGTWSRDGAGVAVRYRLTEVEIQFTGVEKAMMREYVDHPVLQRNAMSFTYHQPASGREFPLKFVRAETLPEKLGERFVECSRQR